MHLDVGLDLSAVLEYINTSGIFLRPSQVQSNLDYLNRLGPDKNVQATEGLDKCDHYIHIQLHYSN